MELKQSNKTRHIVTLTTGQYDHLYNIMCSQDEIIDYLNESDDFDPQTFDNLFDAICNAKETYLPWKQRQKKKWLLTLWKKSLTYYQLANYQTQNFLCMMLWKMQLKKKSATHYTINDMKTITLTDEQFDTLFEYLDGKVESIVNTSVDYQDSELLEDFEDLFEVHDILEDIKVQHEKKLQAARAKQPTAEW